MDSRASQRVIQSGLFDSSSRSLTQSVPVSQEAAPAPKEKAVRKKKEAPAKKEEVAPAPAPVASTPETKAKAKAPRKKKDEPSATASASAAPVSQPAVASAVSATAPSASAPSASAPKSRAKFAKGSQEAKDYMAAIRQKRGAAKAAAVAKAGETPAHSDADDAAVVKKVSRKKKEKVEDEMLA